MGAQTDEDKILAYSVLGGIPHYLKQFDPNESLEVNIKEKILKKGIVLFNEAEYILHQELREPAAYITLLETIAYGSCKFGEVCARADPATAFPADPAQETALWSAPETGKIKKSKYSQKNVFTSLTICIKSCIVNDKTIY
ncbi:MAG: hypothetical protein IK118_01705 [Clostridia bacterium]|nr:hypothetical protein [Clostridia bacterium]